MFFELIPSNSSRGMASAIPAWEAEVGSRYELLVTSYSGLCRCRTGDTVRVHAMYGKMPVVSLEPSWCGGKQHLDDGWMLYIWLPADERWMDNSWPEEGGVCCLDSCRQSSRPWSTEGAFPRTTNSQDCFRKDQETSEVNLQSSTATWRLTWYLPIICLPLRRSWTWQKSMSCRGQPQLQTLFHRPSAYLGTDTLRAQIKSSTCPWWPLAGRDIELFGNKCAVREATSARTTVVPLFPARHVL